MRPSGVAQSNSNGIQSGSRCSPDIADYYSHLHPSSVDPDPIPDPDLTPVFQFSC